MKIQSYIKSVNGQLEL